MIMAADLLDRFLPQIVDGLRKSLAVAVAAEAGHAQRCDGDALDLLFEEEPNLRELIGVLRVLRAASAPNAGKAATTLSPRRNRPNGSARSTKHRSSKRIGR